MKPFVDFFEMRISYMRIDLGCSDVAMSQHGLHATKISAVHE